MSGSGWRCWRAKGWERFKAELWMDGDGAPRIKPQWDAFISSSILVPQLLFSLSFSHHPVTLHLSPARNLDISIHQAEECTQTPSDAVRGIMNIYVESGITLLVRAGFFFASQRLLHTFNPTLRDIAADNEYEALARSDPDGTGADQTDGESRAGTPDIEMQGPILRLHHGRSSPALQASFKAKGRASSRRLGAVSR